MNTDIPRVPIVWQRCRSHLRSKERVHPGVLSSEAGCAPKTSCRCTDLVFSSLAKTTRSSGRSPSSKTRTQIRRERASDSTRWVEWGCTVSRWIQKDRRTSQCTWSHSSCSSLQRTGFVPTGSPYRIHWLFHSTTWSVSQQVWCSPVCVVELHSTWAGCESAHFVDWFQTSCSEFGHLKHKHIHIWKYFPKFREVKI